MAFLIKIYRFEQCQNLKNIPKYDASVLYLRFLQLIIVIGNYFV